MNRDKQSAAAPGSVRIYGIVGLVLMAIWISPINAEVRLPGFFANHMVLQQQKPIIIWGWADAGESVTVSLGEQTQNTDADDHGRWRVTLPARDATSTPVSLKVSGTNEIDVKDVLIGEVWLCSGQSNMEWTVRISNDAEAEIAAANYPLIRHFKVAHRPSMVPLNDIQSEWKLCSPETAGDFTAAGYFMARKLHQELNVPIGLINSSWGGTRVEPWTAPEGFADVPALADIYQSVMGRTPGTDAYQQALKAHVSATEAWLSETKERMEEGDPVTPSPAFPESLTAFRSHQDPTMLYNGMIHALVGYPIRGAIWYQGESNRADGMMYFEKKKALIGGWRKLWKQGDFPFYFVQIAPYQYGNDDPTQLAEFWEAQAAVKSIPNTEMVITNDIATLNDIHPPNKQDVGLRLASIALKNDYGRESFVASSPEFDSLEVLDDRLRVKFKHTAGGLKTRDGKAPSHFEVIGIGSDGFQPAVAKIDGDTVILSSSKVEHPQAFRFAWHKLAEPNLIGGSGLPVGACRGGRLPTVLDSIPGGEDYQLVYDLDLGKLNARIDYDVDRSAAAGKFDRVGYLLELESDDHGLQHVFVSMAPFTDNAKQLRVPTAEAGHSFQRLVSEMTVYTNVHSLNTTNGPVTGAIEFWPNNYAATNSAQVPNASDQLYDIGDSPAEPRNGYGCMQVHNTTDRETVFAINHWSQGANADLGIGNSTGTTRDWTFQGNAGRYAKKRLRIFVRPER